MVQLDTVIDKINLLDDPKTRKNPLPDEGLIRQYEERIGIKFSEDYKIFLQTVSNAFLGYISPLQLSQEDGGLYGDLFNAVTEARTIGVPKDWLPICEDNGNYYCLGPDEKVYFWNHDGHNDESWPSLADWAFDVWINGE